MTAFAIEVTLLTGRYVATSHYDRDTPEWPPHPARLFSAMVDAHHGTDDPDPSERSALLWLETLAPPFIQASDATERPAVTVYVPNNDSQVMGMSLTTNRYTKVRTALTRLAEASTEAKRRSATNALTKARDVGTQATRAGSTTVETALDLLPSGRHKQARSYPSVTPESAVITYIWNNVGGMDSHNGIIDKLLLRVTRLGHSSTLVSCRVVTKLPEAPRWSPDVDGEDELRTTGHGQLSALERRFSDHQAQKPRSLPATMTRYRSGAQVSSHPALAADMAGEWFVFERQSGRQLGAWAVVSLASAVRSALMSALQADIPPLISGHTADGAKVEASHLAVVPLPFVGHRRADGLMKGFALLLPRQSPLLDAPARRRLLEAIAIWEEAGEDQHTVEVRLTRGQGRMVYRRVYETDLYSLRRSRWRGPSSTWVTATPIALNRHPGKLHRGDPARRHRSFVEAEQTVAQSCRDIGLPEPAEVHLNVHPLLNGAVPVRRYPSFVQGRDRHRRALVHATVRFDEVVEGPMLLGAGRYLGLGLMTPTGDRRA